jgi:hypothetical protein
MGVTAIFASRRVRLRSRIMQIIDAQIHLWATGLPSNPAHWAVTHFTAEEAITDGRRWHRRRRHSFARLGSRQ